MPRFQYFVLTQPVAGREAEFEDWYVNQHLPDVLRVPAVVSGRRLRVENISAAFAAPDWTTLAVYEIESDDPNAVVAEVRRRADTPEMPISDALLRTTGLLILAEPLG